MTAFGGGALAEAAVRVVADTARFTAELQAAVDAAVADAERKLRFVATITRFEFATALAELRSRLAAITLTIKVKLDTDIAALRARLASIDAKVKLDPDIAALRATLAALSLTVKVKLDPDIAALQARLATIGNVRITVDAHVSAASLATMRSQIDALGRTVNVRFRLDTQDRARARSQLLDLSRDRLVSIRVQLRGQREVIADLLIIQALLRSIRGTTTIRLNGISGSSGGGSSSPNGGLAGLLTGQAGLLKIATALSPALVDLANASLAGAAGLAALAGAGVLAALGLKDAFNSGSASTQRLRTDVNNLQDDFSKLKITAADAAAVGILPGLEKVHEFFPQLQADVRLLAGRFGAIAGNLLDGLTSGFQTFFPVLDQVAAAAQRASLQFANWAKGPGGATFASALSESFNRVAPLVGALGGAVTALGAALFRLAPTFTPIVTDILNLIKGIGDAFNTVFQNAGVQDFFKGIQSAIHDIVPGLIDVANAVGNVVTSFGPLFTLLGDALQGLGTGLGEDLKIVSSVLNTAATGLSELAGPIVKKDLVVGLENLPALLKHANESAAGGPIAAEQVKQFTDALHGVAPALGITTDQLALFEKELGISADAVLHGKLTAKQYIEQITALNQANQDAGPAQAQFLAALSTFAQSAGTAADRAALLGAQLKLARGDFLGNAAAALNAQSATSAVADAFAGLNVSATQVFQNLVNVSKGATNVGSANKDIVQGSLAVLSAIQGQSDAVIALAQNLFQVNVKTLGFHGASQIAVGALHTLTDELVHNTAVGLGKTDDQARKLLDSLGALPHDSDINVSSKGLPTITDQLNTIADLLRKLIDPNYEVHVFAETEQALDHVTTLQRALENLKDKTLTIEVNTQNNTTGIGGGGAFNPAQAFKGAVVNKPSLYWVGETFNKELILPIQQFPQRATDMLMTHAPWIAHEIANRVVGSQPAPSGPERPALRSTPAGSVYAPVFNASFDLTGQDVDQEVLAKRIERRIMAKVKVRV